MEVVIGSRNEPKRQAVFDAFTSVFPSETIDIRTVEAKSGVSSHPTNGAESLQGAITRAEHSQSLHPGADFYVGIEGGLLQINDRVWEIGWVVIKNSQGEIHTGLSSGLELKGKLLRAVLGGEELSDVMYSYFGIKDLGKSNGFYGLTTDDQITRVSAYKEAVIFALAPFKKPEYFS